MAEITPVVATLAGVDPLSYPSADAAGDFFAAQAQSRYLLHVVNGDASPHDIVLDDPTSAGPAAATAFDPDVTVTVPAGGERMLLVADARRFIDSNGEIQITYGDTPTSVALQVVRV